MPTLPSEAVRESAIELYLVKQLRAYFAAAGQRGIVKKIGGPGWRGWPDRMVLFDGIGGCTHWLEIKRPKGGRFEPLQLRCHRQLRALGYAVRVVNTKALVDSYIEQLRDHGPKHFTP